ncbi:MAG: hypothetical protein M9920_02500 [Verrucomicrobiae bacterium]|nr:hypothetical protein [Verrucomicrobiae bacterium]
MLLLTNGGCNRPDAIALSRENELGPILEATLWKPQPAQDPDIGSNENPGWYNLTNREALEGFVSKYPDTEEAYLAEVWLVFAKAATDRSWNISETKHRNAERADRLKEIIAKSERSGTAKIARIVRACLLLDIGDHAGLRVQVDEILANVRDYEVEKDKQFLRFTLVSETPLKEIEPYMRRMLIISECHQHNLDKALIMAEELQTKFPKWSKREGTDGNIYLLKHGRSPYPTWEELKDVGRANRETR